MKKAQHHYAPGRRSRFPLRLLSTTNCWQLAGMLAVMIASHPVWADDKYGPEDPATHTGHPAPAVSESGHKAAEPMRAQLRAELDKNYAEKYHYYPDESRLIRCESRRGRRQFCPADTRFGVNLERQLSHTSCAGNWGYDQRGIWVRNGCAADFSLNSDWSSAGDQGGNLIRCESEGYRERYCPALLGGRDVMLVRQLSRSTCDGNWGYDRNGIWVTNGCRAEFAIDDRYYQRGDTLVCSSERHRFKRCPVDARWGVEFVRQLSRSSCRGNWGYDQYGIWVDNGCRARFRVTPPPVAGPNPYPDRIRCASRKGRYKLCPVDTGEGVELIKQHSRASCRGNWGYNEQGIWVDNGCRATFRIKRRHGYGGGFPYNQPRHRPSPHNNPYSKPPRHNTPPSHPGYGQQSLPRREDVRCESISGRYRVCPVRRPFATVRLLRQHSRTSCAGKWGQVADGIWVDKGCRATFRVERR